MMEYGMHLYGVLGVLIPFFKSVGLWELEMSSFISFI